MMGLGYLDVFWPHLHYKVNIIGFEAFIHAQNGKKPDFEPFLV